MPRNRADEISIEHESGRTRLRLPIRDLSSHRNLGWLGIGFGAFGVLFMVFWISNPLLEGIDLLRQGKAFGIAAVLFACLGIFGLWISIMVVAAGFGILYNGTFSQIDIFGNRVVSREVFGLFSFRLTNLRFDQIKALEILPLPRDLFGKATLPSGVDLPAEWYLLKAVNATPVRRPPFLAVAYPCELLEQVATMVKAEVSRCSSSHVKGAWFESTSTTVFNQPLVASGADVGPGDSGNELSSSEGGIPIIVRTDTDMQVPVRPPECQVEIVRVAGQPTVFRLPAQGFRGPARGLLAFSCLWNGSVLVMLAFVLAPLINNPQQWEGLLPFLFLFLLLFLAVGVFVMYCAVNLARRTAMIGVDSDFMFCETQELFRKTWAEIPGDNVKSIQVGPSGTELNDEPLMQIQIAHNQPHGKITRLFTGLPKDELLWICYELQREVESFGARGDA